jgi:hypothetical protein
MCTLKISVRVGSIEGPELLGLGCWIRLVYRINAVKDVCGCFVLFGFHVWMV